MDFNLDLNIGDSLNNSKLMETFLCGQQGGMRRSHRTNSLILISDHTKSLYEDLWVDNILHYVGMGTKGDQLIDFQQNKTLAQSRSNDVNLYLFEVFIAGQYAFMGQVKLIQDPYQTQQLDIDESLRRVWVFPLEVINKIQLNNIPEDLVRFKQKTIEKRAKQLSDEKLAKLITSLFSKAGRRSVSSTIYERNPYIAEFAKRRAKGICQLCNCSAPFIDNSGKPYLETHHIIWLSQYGEDTIDNTVALCPNCHRKMHIINSPIDVAKLKKFR